MSRRVVVCGAGSAGCVVAARLSEDPDLSVLLVEAGPDYPDVRAAPEDIRSAWTFGGLAHDWGFVSEDPVAVTVERGRVVGGSSAVNASNASRPSPHDFARWVGLGADAWSWEAVLPWLRRLEDDAAPGEWHGSGGPLPIRRFTADAGLRPVMGAFLKACGELGYAVADDLSAPDAAGAGSIPLNQVDGVRVSAAVAYLAPARARANLEIRANAVVDRLTIADDRVRTVVLAGGERLEADHVVLCAGAIGSPVVLLRSGVGPAEELAAVGVPLVAERDGVGRNLRDHPMAFPAFAAGCAAASSSTTPPLQVMLTCASWGPAAKADVELNLLPFTPDAERLVVGLGLVRAHSVGRVALSDADPLAAPRIALNLLGHPDDLPRLVAGIRIARRLAATEALALHAGEELWPGPGLETDGAIGAAIRATPASYSHVTGTCGMGAADAPWAVVDQTGAAHGIAGLHVIDASIFPASPAVPTNVATIAVAERCASGLRERLGAGTRRHRSAAADGDSGDLAQTRYTVCR